MVQTKILDIQSRHKDLSYILKKVICEVRNVPM